MQNHLQEISQFLKPDTRLDLKSVALESILGLTGASEGITCVLECPNILQSIVNLLNDASEVIAKDAALCLINLSANEDGAAKLLTLENPIIETLSAFIFDPNSHIADPCCMILSNLTRPTQFTDKIIDCIEKSNRTFDDYIGIFTKPKYNKKGASLHYLASFLSNLTQNVRVRNHIADENKCLLQQLLPFVSYKDSLIRRGGVVGTVRNCCFDVETHRWLLSDEVDVLSRLLLPLAGNEEYSDEDNDKLPIDLQYLPEDKTREPDPDIRCMLIEAITQLCAKRDNREYIREKNAYIILRDLHKVETDPKVSAAIENLVDILIRTEEEIEKDNLKDVVVPDHLIQSFNNINV